MVGANTLSGMMRGLKRLLVVMMLITLITTMFSTAAPSVAQKAPDDPAPRTLDGTVELLLSVLNGYSAENFTYWILQNVPALEIRVSSQGQALAGGIW